MTKLKAVPAAWEAIAVPKPRRGPAPSLGANATRNGKPVKLTRSEIAQIAAAAQHGACVDHVKVPGLASKVCILKGQDKVAVVAEAKALAGLA